MHSTEYGWSWTEDGCRWAYLVDFDQNTFEVFGDCEIKQEASTTRFNDVGGDDDSIPPLLKSFSFAQLPATGKEFMRVLKAAMKEKGNNTYGEKYWELLKSFKIQMECPWPDSLMTVGRAVHLAFTPPPLLPSILFITSALPFDPDAFF